MSEKLEKGRTAQNSESSAPVKLCADCAYYRNDYSNYTNTYSCTRNLKVTADLQTGQLKMVDKYSINHAILNASKERLGYNIPAPGSTEAYNMSPKEIDELKELDKNKCGLEAKHYLSLQELKLDFMLNPDEYINGYPIPKEFLHFTQLSINEGVTGIPQGNPFGDTEKEG